MRENFCRQLRLSVHGFALSIVIVLGNHAICMFSSPVLADEQVVSGAENVKVLVGVGGIGRFLSNRWGMTKATITNRGESPVSNLIVVTPAGTGGLQYARQIEVPAKVAFDSVWPVRLSNAEVNGITEFQFLHFPGGEDDGVIRHQQYENEIPTFPGMTKAGPTGLSAWMGETSGVEASHDAIQFLLRAMRFNRTGDQNLVSIQARNLTDRSECLDPLDTLTISESQLTQFPKACEAIRLWVQRGGRLLIMLDSTGPEVVDLLLGECLPLTVVGETTTNAVQLELNPDYPMDRYPVRAVNREFDEPVRYVRVIPEVGETIWSVDNWPVAIRVPLGRGCVVVTTISPDVFVEEKFNRADDTPPYALIASSRRMQESLFNPRVAPLISESAAAQQSAAMIGYEIPSRRAAFLFLTLFPVSLLLVGTLLQRRAGGERLVWVLPALAVLSAVPSIAFGLRVRAIAPATVIEASVIQSSAGQSGLASDGFATVYVPAPTDLSMSSDSGSRLDIPVDNANRDYRRLIWTGPDENVWTHLKQPAGLRTFPVESIRRPESAWQAVATFDEQGIVGQLLSDDPAAAADVMLAGTGLDRLSISVNAEGKFRGTASDLLPPGRFVKSTLISDEQRYRAALLESVFDNANRSELFPAEVSLLFWDGKPHSALQIADQEARRKQMVLVAQSIQLRSPQAGQLITIPSPLLPFRSVATSLGGFGSAFNNSQQQWVAQESAGEILLRYQIPMVCVPLEPESADVELLIRAASRVVTVHAGGSDQREEVARISSPLGTHSIMIPSRLIQDSCLNGHLFLGITVSDLDASMKSDTMTGEQDDSWKIERVSLTLKGRWRPPGPSPAAN
jgi:hypothetical protein